MKIRNFTDIKSLLLDNKTIKQTIFKNAFWLAVSKGISKFLMLILIIYVARILGATEYGKFTFALAFVSLLVIFSNFGLSDIVTRELSQKKEKEKEFSAIFSLKILLGLGALVLMLIGSFFITPDPLIQKMIWILAIYILLNSFPEIIYAFLRARQRMEYESWAEISRALLVTGAGFFVIFNFPSVENLSYSYLFASLLALIFILLFFHFKVYQLSLCWSKAIWQKFLRLSWPLALTGLFATVYTSTDSIMMGYFGQITQTGWYNAAYKITIGALILMSLISQSFYPVLSKFFKESKEKLQKIWNYQFEIMVLFATPLIAGGITLAPRIIDFFYGSSYAPSIFAFQILMVMTGIIFLYSAFYWVLIVANQQKKLFWIILSGAIINIILNLILIPKFSLYGAAIATVITHLLILYLLVRFTLMFIPIKPFNLRFLLSFVGAVLSSMIMYFVIIQPQIYHLHVLLSILVGATVYFATIFIFKSMIRYFSYFYQKEK